MNIRTDTNGDLILEAQFQGSNDHFIRVVPFNLSAHIRQIVRAELNSQTTNPDGSYKPILPTRPYDGKPAKVKP